MSKVFSFFVEPSSYTIALIQNVYNKLNIDRAFLVEKSFSGNINKNKKEVFLSNLTTLEKLKFIFSVYKNNEMIIVNGYNNYVFLILYLINTLSFSKRIIAIESDTQYRIVGGFKGFIKKLYLNTIFQNKYIFGFSGGNFTHKDFFRKYGMSEKHLFLMPMMVDNTLFFKNTKHDDINFTFLFVGRMIPLKNIELLIKNFLNYFNEKPDIVLKIVGTGELFQPLKDKYKEYDNIYFLGSKYNQGLVNEYHTSDVLVLPSFNEQWGLVVNEALAAGLPVIASNTVGAIHDLIIDKETGFVFDLEKKNDLSHKMLQIYQDKSLYKKYSENAERLMKEHWNYNLYEKNLLAAISYADEILKKKEI